MFLSQYTDQVRNYVLVCPSWNRRHPYPMDTLFHFV